MERTLVALWFADIAGYSAHAAKDESGAYASSKFFKVCLGKQCRHIEGGS
jgi:hypothetical protein